MGNNSASPRSDPLSGFEQLRLATDILRQEAEAIVGLAQSLDGEFCRAAELIYACRGNAIVSGMGKAGLIGRKIVATLGSTGTSSHFIHPGEAVHGDLGRLHADDCLLMLSFSGETAEIVRLLPVLKQMKIAVIAVTGRPESTLALAAEVVLDLHVRREACPLGLAPSSSTTTMLALGDALALVVSRMRGFRPEDFARFHPAGSLGQRLSLVDDWMRPLEQCRVAVQSSTVREVFVNASLPGRRTGAIMLTDDDGCLAGIFTDSDLARLLESKQHDALDKPIADCMTRDASTVVVGTRATEALDLFSLRKISELPVVDQKRHPQGMMDITDIIHLLPPANNNSSGTAEEGELVPGTSPAESTTVPFPRLSESPEA